jgi:hypothetical protein
VPSGAPLLGLLVAVLVLVACRAERVTSSGPPAGPLGATSTVGFPLPPATAPPRWSSLTVGPLVREPFAGPGNQFVIAVTANGEGFVAVGEDFQSDAKVDGAI